MAPEQLMDVLKANYAFNVISAQAHVEANGYCRYCGEDIYASFLNYSSSHVDHILPKSKYPNLDREPSNFALSCFFCNQQKSDYDPLQGIETAGSSNDPQTALLSQREQLIKIASSHLANELSRKKRIYNEIRGLLRS